MKTIASLVLALSIAALAKKDLAAVNINSAPADSLVAHLPEVGPTIAARIVAARPYAKCDDLTENVKGIGAAKIAKICPLLTF